MAGDNLKKLSFGEYTSARTMHLRRRCIYSAEGLKLLNVGDEEYIRQEGKSGR
jgi:hypothetical protein